MLTQSHVYYELNAWWIPVYHFIWDLSHEWLLCSVKIFNQLIWFPMIVFTGNDENQTHSWLHSSYRSIILWCMQGHLMSINDWMFDIQIYQSSLKTIRNLIPTECKWGLQHFYLMSSENHQFNYSSKDICSINKIMAKQAILTHYHYTVWNESHRKTKFLAGSFVLYVSIVFNIWCLLHTIHPCYM